MVTNYSRDESGSLMTELMVAMAILTIAFMPLAYGFSQEQKLARSSYQRAVAMELVDGEMEILLAGGWHDFKQGAQAYTLHGNATTNLTAGTTTLTLNGKKLRLEWQSGKKGFGAAIVREAEAR